MSGEKKLNQKEKDQLEAAADVGYWGCKGCGSLVLLFAQVGILSVYGLINII